jgi:PPOX class probable F420-dependent enzyme
LSARLTPKAIKLIEGKNFAHVATIMPDGSPQVTPMWVDRDGGTILVNTRIGRVKQKNLARDPRVAISIADQSNPYDKVVIRGHVVSQTTEGADEHIDKLAKKYTGEDFDSLRTPGEKRIIIKVKPKYISD